MANEIATTPVVVNVVGATSTDRKLSVVQNASGSALLALANKSGAVGKFARNGAAMMGLEAITKACSHDNYRPLAEYLAATLGESFVVSNRATFESLPDQFEQRILKIKGTKSGGMREDKKTGALVANAALKTAMTLKAECVTIIAMQAAIRAERKAEHDAKQAALTAQ